MGEDSKAVAIKAASLIFCTTKSCDQAYAVSDFKVTVGASTAWASIEWEVQSIQPKAAVCETSLTFSSQSETVCSLYGICLGGHFYRHHRIEQIMPGKREAGCGHNQRFTKYWYVSANMGFGPSSI